MIIPKYLITALTAAVGVVCWRMENAHGMRDVQDAIDGKLVTDKRWMHPRDWLRLEYCQHITVDESLTRRSAQYSVIRFGGGDGSYDQELDLIHRTLLPLVEASTYFNGGPDLSATHDIHYTIGLMRAATVFGRVELRCGGKYPGQRQSVCIPVVTEWRVRA